MLMANINESIKYKILNNADIGNCMNIIFK